MRTLFVLLFSGFISFAVAEPSPMQQLNTLLASSAAQEKAYAAGHERISFCKHCHGEDGNSKRNYIPNLAEQNPIYLFNAFEKFANGERTHFVMSKLATRLTTDDRVNIALYYGLQKVIVNPSPSMPQRAKGQAKFSQVCQGCHGAKGEGKEDMPRLAGQHSEYIIRTLTNFRNKDSSRAASVMLSIAENMSDDEIDAVAQYIQSLDI